MKRNITVEELKQFPTYKTFFVFNKGYGSETKKRAVWEGDTVFVYGKGRKRYGYRYSNLDNFVSQYDVEPPKNEEKEEKVWHKRIDRAIKCLESSGLSPELLEYFKKLRSIPLKDLREMKDIYHESYNKGKWDELLKIQMNDFQDKGFLTKYPFAFYETKDGIKAIEHDFIDEKSNCKLKSMYFGYRNKSEKEWIKKALENKEDYSTRVRTSYDVTFTYDAKKNRAWYDEEYKNCGNGHYYLALDHSTALFIEND